jgi:hypothetical protein
MQMQHLNREINLKSLVHSHKQGIYGRLVRTTHEGGITWTQQNKNIAERRYRIHSQTHFSANVDMQ